MQTTNLPLKAIALKLIELYDFAESDQNAITSSGDLSEIKNIIESSYTDGISSIRNVRINSKGSVVGTFDDVVTPRLTKKFDFAIAGDGGLTYKMLNPQDVDDFADITHFSESEWLDFATGDNPQQKRECKKGTSCGRRCIHKGYTCHADHATPEKQKESRDLVTRLRNEAKKSGTFKPKLQISREKKEAEAKALNEKIAQAKNHSTNSNEKSKASTPKEKTKVASTEVSPKIPAQKTESKNNTVKTKTTQSVKSAEKPQEKTKAPQTLSLEQLKQNYAEKSKAVLAMKNGSKQEQAEYADVGGSMHRFDAVKSANTKGAQWKNDPEYQADTIDAALKRITHEPVGNGTVDTFLKSALSMTKEAYGEMTPEGKKHWANNEYMGFKNRFGSGADKVKVEQFAKRSKIHEEIVNDLVKYIS